MLIVRETQVRALEDHKRSKYIQSEAARIRNLMRLELRSLGIDPADGVEVSRFVQSSVRMAQAYGIENEQDVRVFIDCRLTLGSEFFLERGPARASAMLERTDLSGTQKADLLHDLLLYAVR